PTLFREAGEGADRHRARSHPRAARGGAGVPPAARVEAPVRHPSAFRAIDGFARSFGALAGGATPARGALRRGPAIAGGRALDRGGAGDPEGGSPGVGADGAARRGAPAALRPWLGAGAPRARPPRACRTARPGG